MAKYRRHITTTLIILEKWTKRFSEFNPVNAIIVSTRCIAFVRHLTSRPSIFPFTDILFVRCMEWPSTVATICWNLIRPIVYLVNGFSQSLHGNNGVSRARIRGAEMRVVEKQQQLQKVDMKNEMKEPNMIYRNRIIYYKCFCLDEEEKWVIRHASTWESTNHSHYIGCFIRTIDHVHNKESISIVCFGMASLNLHSVEWYLNVSLHTQWPKADCENNIDMSSLLIICYPFVHRRSFKHARNAKFVQATITSKEIFQIAYCFYQWGRWLFLSLFRPPSHQLIRIAHMVSLW